MIPPTFIVGPFTVVVKFVPSDLVSDSEDGGYCWNDSESKE